MSSYLNLIDGVWRSSESGRTFMAGQSASRGSCPRSDRGDVKAVAATFRQALESRDPPAGSLPDEALRAAQEVLGNDPDPSGEMSLILGLDPTEAGALLRLQAGSTPIEPAPFESGLGAIVVQCHWGELLTGPFLKAAAILRQGLPVLLLPDACCPALACRVAEVLLACGVPSGMLGLLHSEGEHVFKAVARSQCFQGVWISGAESCEALVSRWLEVESNPGASALKLRFDALRAGTDSVRYGEDLQQAVDRIVALGPASATTLFGQLPGSLGQVVVDPRVFSAFTQDLLLALSESPLPQFLIDPELPAYLHGAMQTGLDEGATLIWGELPARWGPAVLTNVEPGSATAHEQQPRNYQSGRPVVCLCRRQLDIVLLVTITNKPPPSQIYTRNRRPWPSAFLHPPPTIWAPT